MRVVIDGVSLRGDNSNTIVMEQMLGAWSQLGLGDDIHLVLREGADIASGAGITVHRVRLGPVGVAGRLWAQTITIPRVCRSLRADVMLGVLPATSVSTLPCPRAVLAWDFRYRALPQQYSLPARLIRRLSYAIGFRQADAVACISERTRQDLLTYHPKVGQGSAFVAHLG